MLRARRKGKKRRRNIPVRRADAEADAEAPQLLLSVTDSQENRPQDDVPAVRGINRFTWNLRGIPPTAPTGPAGGQGGPAAGEAAAASGASQPWTKKRQPSAMS